MTIHYHGTPITPNSELEKLAGRHFCVSFANPAQVKRCIEIGQSVMLDNGAFSFWRRGEVKRSWLDYYAWVEKWLGGSAWAVIPDAIDAGEEENDRLLADWVFSRGIQGAPVWHMDESIARLLRLNERYSRICFGSAGKYMQPGSDDWCRRMDAAWNALERWFFKGQVHLLRGMKFSDGHPWPFASVDSTDIAQNHNQGRGRRRDIAKMADRWDTKQCPTRWLIREQQELEGVDDGRHGQRKET